MEKFTQRDNYNTLLAVIADSEYEDSVKDRLTEFVASRIALLDKKSANKKPSKTAEANEALKAVVAEVLTAEGATVSEIMAKDSRLADLSNQKVSAILRLMVADGTAVKTVDKKRSLFALA